MASALGAARVGDIGKKLGQGLHLLGTEHDFGVSCTIGGFKNRPG